MTRTASEESGGAGVLYLSYDGITDPLGGSQVLPYLVGLSKHGHRISLISFEKPGRTAEERKTVADLCTECGIDWHPLAYHHRPPVLSTIGDVRRMYRLALRLHREHRFDLVHCRSYIPALAGLWLKRRTGIRFLFDMRGFWADERVDGGIWRLTNPLFRVIYAYFKRREHDFLHEADHVVSLTEEGRRLLATPGKRGALPMTVIPCCTDFAAFPPVSRADRLAMRALLGIPHDATVAAYLGSFGSWYLVDEMLDFFKVQLYRCANSMFLIVSREPEQDILSAASRRGVPKDRIIVRSASRAEVPQLMSAADYGLFFIMPVFSKKASCPTKMGEFLALELPIVTNGGVGDVALIVEETGSGVVIDRFERRSYEEALDSVESLRPKMDRWRIASRKWFDLEQGVDRYDAIYRSCLSRA